MAIIRATRPEQHYTQIRNDVLRDERLSYRARGVLAVILSRPDDWSTTSEALARQGQEGRDAIRTALNELEAAGYLRRERRQDSQGRWSTQAVVYDTPRSAEPTQEALPIEPGHTDDGFPGVGSPTTDSQASVSQALLRTPTTNSPPTGERAKPADEAHAIAKAVYDAAGGMVPFMGVRAVAGKALRQSKGRHSAEAIEAAMIALYREGRPLTITVLGQRLNGTTARVGDTHAEHWANPGASFSMD